MSKFAAQPRSSTPRTETHEGAPAFKPSPGVELLLTAATSLVNEQSFYETAEERDQRLVELVHRVSKLSPAVVAQVAKDLRTKYQMRSSSIVVAAEYLHAYLNSEPRPTGGATKRNWVPPRQVLDSVMVRADEPGELLAYWLGKYGKPLPKALKNALGDAVYRLYNERNVLKYNSKARSVRMADVVELAGSDDYQLWKYLLDDRHHGDGQVEGLPMLKAHAELAAVPEDKRRGLLRSAPASVFQEAGFTWERISSWVPGGMDAEAWEAIIPSMGVMALIRNLRNFDQAGIGKGAREKLIAKITSAEDVQASRIFPYQVMSAYEHSPSDYYKAALGETFEHTLQNVPRFDRCLILVDVSGSMTWSTISARSKVRPADIACCMGVAVASASTNSDLVAFASENVRVEIPAGTAALAAAVKLRHGQDARYFLGGGTYAGAAMQKWFDPERHDRVLVFTDGQWHDQRPRHVPQVVIFDLAHYGRTPVWGLGNSGDLLVGGYSDAMFRVVADVLGMT